MGLFSFLASLFRGKSVVPNKDLKPDQNGKTIVPPWQRGRISVYDHLKGYAHSTVPLPEQVRILPDEAEQRARNPIPWAAGGIDGVLGVQEDSDEQAAQVFALIKQSLEKPGFSKMTVLYDYLVQDDYFHYVDKLVDFIIHDSTIKANDLEVMGAILATSSPDRKPVKLGIVLLGLLTPTRFELLFSTLGRHEEFTLYAIIAILRTLSKEEAEERIWELAKVLEGWGRIQAVRRLLTTEREDIKAWLIREGFKNSVMYDYLAYDCALAGNLIQALQAENVDQELLNSAGQILETLSVTDGPCEDMLNYHQGARAADLWLEHLEKRPSAHLTNFLAANALRDFAKNYAEETLDWTAQFSSDFILRVNCFLARPEWRGIVLEHLVNQDDDNFFAALQAADILGIDVWETRFQSQQSGKSTEWLNLLTSSDPERIKRVVELAEQNLLFKEELLKPTDDLTYALSMPCVEMTFVLQGLQAHPGCGWPIVEAGLMNPVIQNRKAALAALENWGNGYWPAQTPQALEKMLFQEPDPEVKNTIRRLLTGTAMVS